MRLRSTPAELLLRLSGQAALDPSGPLAAEPRASDEPRAVFRQLIAALAQEVGALGPPSLDGLDPRSVEAAGFVAIERGFLDDLGFISAGGAALGLYELSSACAVGQVKRDLRRRVFGLLYEGNAATFLPVAARIALGTPSPLATPTLRARVALSLALPLGASVNVGPLAYALATRTNTHDGWVGGPSLRALSARRLAARLLEHAAREAVERARLGDPQLVESLLEGASGTALERLLADREPLVWQHAAVARGLLATVDLRTRQRVEQALSPELGITEWRRAAVSLVASTAYGDQEASQSVEAVLTGALAKQDPGLAAVFPLGLPRVIEQDPERATELLARLSALRRPDVARTAADLLATVRDRAFAREARVNFRETLTKTSRDQSPAERALLTRSIEALAGEPSDDPELFVRVQGALLAFEEQGARAAYEQALAALREAHDAAEFIESADPSDELGMATALGALVELDRGAFQSGELEQLLLLGRRPGDPDGLVEPYERLQARAGRWILSGIEATSKRSWSRDGALLDQRRLQVLLHLVDADSSGEEDGERQHGGRLERAISTLLERLAQDPDALVHRVLCAALARSFDAAVRTATLLPSDLALAVSSQLSDHHAIATIAEASTMREVSGPLRALSSFLTPEEEDALDEGLGGVHEPDGRRQSEKRRVAKRFLALGKGVIGSGSYHAEALRRVLLRLGRCLEAIGEARSQLALVALGESGQTVLDELGHAVDDLIGMIRHAERRVLLGAVARESTGYGGPGLRGVLDQAASSGVGATALAISEATEALVAGLPEAFRRAVEQVVFGIHELPLATRTSTSLVPAAERAAPLPNWLLPRRTIGSFYVVRSLGSGGVSSVFLARRYDERLSANAETFAVKVPEYDPATARSMSEAEFFQMFKEEAGALLSLPAHQNLARFVTFDLSARPKPILVMEHIRGTPLDRIARSSSLTVDAAFDYLDGILAGLGAMHGAGVGHLDVKASNVIVRDGGVPVLVDFGLSGRKLRPGCGTVEYTAPEVLGVAPDGYVPTPPAADIYAFGCLAYELLTSHVLFEGQDEMALVSKHVSHDGWMPELARMNEVPGLGKLARTLGGCLRHDPRSRPSITDVRQRLAVARTQVGEMSWPLPRGLAVAG